MATPICVRCGEPSFGTTAHHGELMFTLRAERNATMQLMAQRAEEMADRVVRREGGIPDVTVEWLDCFEATENDPELVAALAEEVTLTCAAPPMRKPEPFRWSEDLGALFAASS